MARRTVSVEYSSKNPDDLLTLINAILKADADQSDTSKKLPTAVSTALQSVTDTATPIRSDAKAAEATAQTKNQQARQLLGIDKGQDMTVPGTGLNLINKAKKNLLNYFEGNEEALTGYGFEVEVGTAKSPTKKTKIK